MNRPRGRPFSAGNQFGQGRPKGSRNRWTLEAQKLLEKYSESVVSKCIASALAGNPHAQRLCLERILPAKRDSAFRLKLGPTKTAQDVSDANEAVMQAVAKGQVPVASGETMARMLDLRRHAIETGELEARIEQLEKHKDQETS